MNNRLILKAGKPTCFVWHELCFCTKFRKKKLKMIRNVSRRD